MIGFVESFLIWLASTIIPVVVGLTLIVWLGRLTKPKLTAAFAFGIFLWFFVDTIEGSAGLYKDTGFGGGADQVASVGLFILGLLLFVWADRNRSIFNSDQAMGKYGIVIPLMVSVAVGIHGLGEGTAFGANVSSTSSATLLDAFGGLNAGIAYVLHKALEPMMVGACYLVYSANHAENNVDRLKDSLLLSLVFVIPSLVGAATGYYLIYNTAFFFALATGTSIYAAIRLAGPMFDYKIPASAGDSLRLATMIILGFLAIYVAALFHS